MTDIASTPLGRNSLFIALIAHTAALIVAMMPLGGADFFFGITYPLYFLTFVLGLFAELIDSGYRTFGNWRFYLASIAAIFPIIGPLMALSMLYNLKCGKSTERSRFGGAFMAIMRLRANAGVIALSILMLFILFALSIRQNDSYFRKANVKSVLLEEERAMLNYCSHV